MTALATPLYYFVVCYLLVQAGYFTYRQITTRISRRRMIKEHGCQPANSFDETSWFPYPFRLKMVKLVRSAAEERTLIQSTREKYQQYGYTHSGKVSFHQTLTLDIER